MASTTNTPAIIDKRVLDEEKPIDFANDRTQSTETQVPEDRAMRTKRDYKFWLVMVALCITSLLSSLENTVVVTSLPAIVQDLSLGRNYVWISNIFFLTSAAVQPLFGQLSNLFGRRRLALFIVATFTLGSGLCGGANTPAMLIAARAVQGIGSGGINMIIDVIISDLVPLRERGNYISIILVIYGIGTAIGPFLGGVIVQSTSWRWVFYINLPVGGLALLLLFLFLRVKWNKSSSILSRLLRIDLFGNGVLIASTVAVLIALTWAGVVYPWSSWYVLVPLILGLAGLLVFAFFETLPFVREPVMPLRLFSNRTSLVIYTNTFLNSALLYWVFFFVPIFFQSVQLSSPARSGVQILPLCLVGVPGAAISVLVLSKWGKYKGLHVAGFGLLTIGLGLFGLMSRTTTTTEWVLIQTVPALGSGMLLNTLLPAFQASTEEKEQAAATATWSFIRSFGNVWGVAIAAAIFNTYCADFAAAVDDPGARALLQNGDAYASATRAFVQSFEDPVRSQIIEVFNAALKKVFFISIAFGGLAFVLTMCEKDIKLRTELETEFGLEERDGAGLPLTP